MRADYSELGYFWGTNSYPYIDLNYISNDKQYSNEDNDIDAQEINQFIKSTSDAFTKMTEVSLTLNIDVIKTKIKVLSQAADYAFNPCILDNINDEGFFGFGAWRNKIYDVFGKVIVMAYY